MYAKGTHYVVTQRTYGRSGGFQQDDVKGTLTTSLAEASAVAETFHQYANAHGMRYGYGVKDYYSGRQIWSD